MSVPFSPDQFVKGRKTKRIPLADLKPTQVYVNQDKVERMSQKPGRDLPPIVASTDGYVYDGHHRHSAAKLRGRKTVDAVQF